MLIASDDVRANDNVCSTLEPPLVTTHALSVQTSAATASLQTPHPQDTPSTRRLSRGLNSNIDNACFSMMALGGLNNESSIVVVENVAAGRHWLLLWYYKLPSVFEEEFTVYYHSNRRLPIVFSAFALLITLFQAVIVSRGFGDNEVILPSLLIALWALIIVAMLYLAYTATHHHGSGASGDKFSSSNVFLAPSSPSMFSSTDGSERRLLRRNAWLHELCTAVSLQLGAIGMTGTIRSKESNPYSSDFYRQSILTDGLLILLFIFTVGLCPVRFTWYVPNILLMNLHFFLFRPVPGFPEVVWVYLWSQVILCVVVSALCVVSAYFIELRRRIEFEAVLELQTQLIQSEQIRKRSGKLQNDHQVVPFGIAREALTQQAVAWRHPNAAVVVLTLSNYAAWVTHRPPLDAVELVRRIGSAIEVVRLEFGAASRSVTPTSRHSMSSSQGSWSEIAACQTHGDQSVFVSVEHTPHDVVSPPSRRHLASTFLFAEELRTAIDGVIKCQRQGDWFIRNPIHAPDKFVDCKSHRKPTSQALGAVISIDLGEVLGGIAALNGMFVVGGPAVQQAARCARLPLPVAAAEHEPSHSASIAKLVASVTSIKALTDPTDDPSVNIQSYKEEMRLDRAGRDITLVAVTLQMRDITRRLEVWVRPRDIALTLEVRPNHASKRLGTEDASATTESSVVALQPQNHHVISKTSAASAIPVNERVDLRSRMEYRYFNLFCYFSDALTEAAYTNESAEQEWAEVRSLWSWLTGTALAATLPSILRLYGPLEVIEPSVLSPVVWAEAAVLIPGSMLVLHLVLWGYLGLSRVPSVVGVLDLMCEWASSACYFIVVVLTPGGNVIGNGRLVWMFVNAAFLLVRPQRHSLLISWSLDVVMSLAFLIDSWFQSRGPSAATYRYMGIALSAVQMAYMLAMRLQRDQTHRDMFVVRAKVALLDEELEREYNELAEFMERMAPKGVAAEMIRRVKKRGADFKRLLHPDRSTNFTTTTDDLEALTIHLRPSSAFGDGTPPLMVGAAFEDFAVGCREVEKGLKVLFDDVPLEVVTSTGDWIVLGARYGLKATGKEKAGAEERCAALLTALPHVIRLLRRNPSIEYRCVLNSGPTTGAVIMNGDRPLFDYFGPMVAMSQCIATEAPAQCAMATNRFMHRSVVGLGDRHGVAVDREAFEVTLSDGAQCGIGKLEVHLYAGCPPIGVRSVHVTEDTLLKSTDGLV